jgi:hypothetical protein
MVLPMRLLEIARTLPLRSIISIPAIVGIAALGTACGSGAINASVGGEKGGSGEGGEGASSGSGGSSGGTGGSGGASGGKGNGGKGGTNSGKAGSGNGGTGNSGAGEGGESSSSGGSSAGTSSGGMATTAGTGGIPSCEKPTGSGGSGGPTGEWVEIDVPINYDDCGAQTMLVDPARPSDFYALVCAGSDAGTLKSTDFGQTFERVDTRGFSGNPTGGAIDPNPCRDPSTPPTLYSTAFGADLGLWKSVDGGVNWRQMIPEERGSVPGLECSDYWPPDFYGVAVLPDNPPHHILVTYHAAAWNCAAGGFAESLDGGETFIEHRGPSGWGSSDYPVVIDSQTWLIVNEEDAVWRTTTAGRVNGVVSPDAWTRVSSAGHTHGSFQAFVTPEAIYIPGKGGIFRSTDKGATWDNVYDVGQNFMDSVIGTERYLYANAFYAPELKRASADTGSDWEDYTDLPGGMGQGPAPHGAATSFDGSNWVVITANDDSGIWRYVEP